MIAEFSIFQVNECTPISRAMAEAVKLVETSGLPYRLTQSSICVEGALEELFHLIQKCHARVRERSSHVMTTVSIEDKEGAIDEIGEGGRAVEEKITHPVQGWKPKIRNVKPSTNTSWAWLWAHSARPCE